MTAIVWLAGAALALIIAVAMILRKRRDTFIVAAPATRRAIEGASTLFTALSDLGALAHDFERVAAPLIAKGEHTRLTGALLGIEQLSAPLTQAARTLRGTPPTYSNFAAIYRRLACDDAYYRAAADTFAEGSYGLSQVVLGGTSASDTYAYLADLLGKMGDQMRRVSYSIHFFGASLDLE